MGKSITVALIVGLVVGLVFGILLKAVPAIGNAIPANMQTMIIGGVAGAAAAIAAARANTK